MSGSNELKRQPDLFGMSGAGRQVNRTGPSCRKYAENLWKRGVRGVFMVDNGDLVVNRAGIEELRAEAARLAAKQRLGRPREDKR
ncbi:MAG TPA: hypothetical protein VMT66_16910 [Steroidobacteraceae bacterium]|nr:hypothetical protein [Steroidobacteraceae bacterium]